MKQQALSGSERIRRSSLTSRLAYIAALSLMLASPVAAEAREITIPFTLGAPINIPDFDLTRERVGYATFRFSGAAHFHYESNGLGYPPDDPMEEWSTPNFLTVLAVIGSPDSPLVEGAAPLECSYPSFTHGDRNTVYVADADISFSDQLAWGNEYYPNFASIYGKTLWPTSALVIPDPQWGNLSMWSNFKFGNTALTIVTRPVPEPSSWAAMLGGFALVGGAMRYRRNPEASFA